MAVWDAAWPCAGTAAGGSHLHPSQAAVGPLLSPHQGQSCRHWGLALCVSPPPPPVWCTHGEGGAVHLLLAAGGGWESEAPLPAWDLCSGGECVWENGSSVCKSQGKKKNPQKPKQFPLDLCPLLGLAAAPDLGVQSSGMLVLPSLAPAAAGAWPEPAWALACSGTPLLKPVWSKLFTFLGWGWHLRRQSGTWGALG